MRSWSVDDVMELGPGPGYPRERIEKLWDGRERLNVEEVAKLDIPIEDRLWLLLEQKSVERIMTRAVTDYALHCGHPTVEEWARRWLSGEDRTCNSAARAARYDPATAQATTARLVAEAAENAGCPSWAADSVADAAWWAAAWSAAAKSAAHAASAYNKERNLQLQDVLSVERELTAEAIKK